MATTFGGDRHLLSLASRVEQYYESIGAEPRPGIAPHELAEFESAHGTSLPHPVSEFYLAFDGLEREVPEFGFHALQLWRLGELARVTGRVAEFRGAPDYGPIVHTLPDADQYIAFGDGAIWSHVLAFRLSPDAGPILWISGGSFARVASNFAEFWERYLEDPDSMLSPTSEQIISPAF